MADKVAAIIERHGEGDRASTRVKDLVDLVAIVTETSVDAELQRTALESEAKRRGISLPGNFDVPDRLLWQTGYASEAGRSLLPVAHTLDEALGIVRPYLDPTLDGTATGRWDPKALRWVRRGKQSPRSGFSHIRLAVTMASRRRRLLPTTRERDFLRTR